tara:strand:+ start:456 stop:935 length:480 start_codon:yes stop_codon:yes gene_type:complete
MDFLQTTNLSISQKNDIFHLWNEEYPAKLAFQSIVDLDRYLDGLREQSHILIVDQAGKVKAWYFDFIREGAKWFAIILNVEIQGRGFGTKLLNFAKAKEEVLNGWLIDNNRESKINGEFYKSPLNFYLKNGFEIEQDSRLKLDEISAVKIKWTTGSIGL